MYRIRELEQKLGMNKNKLILKMHNLSKAKLSFYTSFEIMKISKEI